jgi:hypothetical protein
MTGAEVLIMVGLMLAIEDSAQFHKKPQHMGRHHTAVDRSQGCHRKTLLGT